MNIGLHLFDKMIERAACSIEYKMLSIPLFIVAIHYFVPAWQFMTADVGGAAFRSPPVDSQVPADQFNLDDMCRALQGGLSPANAACLHWIDAVDNNGVAELEIFGGKDVGYGIPLYADGEACIPQALFNGVDPKIRRRKPHR